MAKHKSNLFRAQDYLHPKFWLMWLTIGFLRLSCLLPYPVLLKLGRGTGRIIQHLSGKRQRIVDINLQLCFPEKTAPQREQIKRQTYQNLGMSLYEMAMCWWWKPEQLKKLVEIRGLEHIDQCLENKKGVILLTGHYTSLELGGRLLSLYKPFQVMYRTQRNPLFDSLLYTKRSQFYTDVISRKNSRRLIKGIRNKILTWYAPDQDFTNERNVFVPFFGVPTATITASTRLAESGNAAMLPFFPQRKADGSGYILWIKPPLENFPSGDETIDASAVNASIQQFVEQHPDQYMWVHQRFKTRPPGEPKIY